MKLSTPLNFILKNHLHNHFRT